MPGNVRDYLLNNLALPDDWKRVDEQRIPQIIERPTVIVKHDRFEKLPEAPIGALRNVVVLAVFIPNQDLAKAEAAMDDAMAELLTALDGHEAINWSEAQKVVTPNGLYPGWELSLSVISTPEPKE
ncbi:MULTISPECIES: hypothetical protein [unclassified Leucobacter]|uniref:hypothetical protein n=1 Tax=unclassified Leucobacter TaxID=2621730 RepID=UPI00062193EF|nr:hypothetical protein [Leucobacter sp. Ag1]KKI19665.1 hypothetical protein XM48_09375 [Leucobacter sp. Ag1]